MRFAWLGVVAAPIVSIAMVVTVACAASSNVGQGPAAPSPAVPAGWSTYSNSQYGFTVSYPDAYGIVPEKTPPVSGASLRVRFQDKALLTSDFVDLEPARFTVEVFVSDQPTTLMSWLRARNRIQVGAVTSSIVLMGAQEGLRVQQSQQLAPNDFYYFIAGRYIFALTPLGSHSAEMLASFRLA